MNKNLPKTLENLPFEKSATLSDRIIDVSQQKTANSPYNTHKNAKTQEGEKRTRRTIKSVQLSIIIMQSANLLNNVHVNRTEFVDSNALRQRTRHNVIAPFAYSNDLHKLSVTNTAISGVFYGQERFAVTRWPDLGLVSVRLLANPPPAVHGTPRKRPKPFILASLLSLPLTASLRRTLYVQLHRGRMHTVKITLITHFGALCMLSYVLLSSFFGTSTRTVDRRRQPTIPVVSLPSRLRFLIKVRFLFIYRIIMDSSHYCVSNFFKCKHSGVGVGGRG